MPRRALRLHGAPSVCAALCVSIHTTLTLLGAPSSLPVPALLEEPTVGAPRTTWLTFNITHHLWQDFAVAVRLLNRLLQHHRSRKQGPPQQQQQQEQRT